MKTFIKGYCFTNLDGYDNFRWPTSFVAVPRVGKRMNSIGGERSLSVVMVSHYIDINTKEQRIEVELNR